MGAQSENKGSFALDTAEWLHFALLTARLRRPFSSFAGRYWCWTVQLS